MWVFSDDSSFCFTYQSSHQPSENFHEFTTLSFWRRLIWRLQKYGQSITAVEKKITATKQVLIAIIFSSKLKREAVQRKRSERHFNSELAEKRARKDSESKKD